MVLTGHGIPGKSWNFAFYFQGLESHERVYISLKKSWNSCLKVMKSHGFFLHRKGKNPVFTFV